MKKGICPWRKPLEEWLKQAQDAGKTALSPSLSDKKSLLQKICGVNLSLQNRKVHFTPQKQWAALSAALEKKSETDVCCVLVDNGGNTSNRLFDYLSRFWTFYQSNITLQNLLVSN